MDEIANNKKKERKKEREKETVEETERLSSRDKHKECTGAWTTDRARALPLAVAHVWCREEAETTSRK